eukprot:12221398-Ditylum_brightwellii.AAC.1
MESNIFTKKCACPAFEKHAAKFVGHDEYMAEGIDHGTPKGRVSDVGCCEYHGGTYKDIKVSLLHEYFTIMDTFTIQYCHVALGALQQNLCICSRSEDKTQSQQCSHGGFPINLCKVCCLKDSASVLNNG